MAVFARGSLGVAGLQAQERLGATAAQLGLLSMLQLSVYAGMQVPAGVLLDRFGPRRLVAAGALVIAAGQLLLATADDVPAAVLARVLVGTGDALTFLSVLRLVSAWFPPSRVPVVTQLTGLLGQLGQVAATFPLVALLHAAGWSATFLGVAAVGLTVAGLSAAALRDGPPGAAALPAPGLAQVRARLRAAWSEPGTRLGLWTHFVTQFSATAFGLLWGYPFLVAGQGLRPSAAGLLLSLLVVAGALVGPVVGALAARWPQRRSALVVAVVGVSAAAWTAVLAWPGRAPLWLLVVLVLALATNGPGSLLGFDYARTGNPPDRLGSATGIVNIGGFVAALTLVLAVGLVLDLRGGTGPAAYELADFKVALCLQYPLWALGLQRVVAHRRVLRRRRLDRTGVLVDPLHAALRRKARERRVRDRRR